MKKLLVLVILFIQFGAFAQNTCGFTTQGFDNFPWSVAQPFAWNEIQGIWKVDSQPETLFRFKVTRQTSRFKQLNVEVYSRLDCSQPVMKGIGLVSVFEKNVVRINMDNKLMKIAWFDSRDLKMNPLVCGQTVLATSIIDLEGDLFYTAEEQEPTILMLKKITSSLDLFCKKHN